MVTKIITSITILLFSISCIGQDSLKIDSDFSIVTRGQHNLVFADNIECLHCSSGKVADNPFFHLGVYTGIDHKLTLNEKYSLETSLYLEERSYSGGNNTVGNFVVYPRIRLTVDEPVRIFGKDAIVSIIGGDFWGENVGDILRLYNIDYHALSGSIKINDLSFGFMTIGDLSRNIGLDLHQLYRFSLTYETENIKNVSAINVNEVFAFPRGSHPAPVDFNVSNYFKRKFTEQSNIEGQAEIRVVKNLPLFVALGIKMNYANKSIKLSSSLRYFQAEFNQGYNGRLPVYRGVNGRYVGTQLYPLKNYYREFSQWAVYTHMQDQDLLAIAFTCNWESDKKKKLGFFMDLDINYIANLTDNKKVVYPMYNGGIQVNFLEIFNGRLSLTNKHMDLSNFYQTFSVSRIPLLSLGFNMDLSGIGFIRKCPI